MTVVYPELIGEMAKRQLTRVQVAKAIGVSTRTLYSKLTGETDFTLSEAKTIHNQFFPDVPQDSLFFRPDERPGA